MGISWMEFGRSLEDERVEAYINALKLDTSAAEVLFMLLDEDHNDEVSVNEFLAGCYQLAGEPRTLDLKIMLIGVERITSMLSDMHATWRYPQGPARADEL